MISWEKFEDWWYSGLYNDKNGRIKQITKQTCLTEFMPTRTDEISLFDKLYCMDNFEMFFPLSLQ